MAEHWPAPMRKPHVPEVNRQVRDRLMEQRDTLVLYTDGSSGLEGSGCAVAYHSAIDNNWTGVAVPLSASDAKDSGIAELYGIHAAFSIALGLIQAFRAARLLVLSDSQAALYWLSRPSSRLKVGVQLMSEVASLVLALQGAGVDLNIGWVKGHDNVPGNVVADMLAGYATKQSRDGAVHGIHMPPPNPALLQVRAAEARHRAELTSKKELKRLKKPVRAAGKSQQVQNKIPRGEKKAALRAERAARRADVRAWLEAEESADRMEVRRSTKLARIAEPALARSAPVQQLALPDFLPLDLPFILPTFTPINQPVQVGNNQDNPIVLD